MVTTVSRKLIGQLVEIIVEGEAKKVTKYLSPKLVVKATRHGKVDRRSTQVHVLLTLGRPNFTERQFIKKCEKAGERFPVRKHQIKWPKK